MIWIIAIIVAAFLTWLALIIVMLVREDNRIRTDPWIRPVVVRSSAVELARAAQETERLLDWAYDVLEAAA